MKNAALILLISLFTLVARGQIKTYPDTLFSSNFIQVIRTNYDKEVIIFSNGKKIYNYDHISCPFLSFEGDLVANPECTYDTLKDGCIYSDLENCDLKIYNSLGEEISNITIKYSGSISIIDENNIIVDSFKGQSVSEYCLLLYKNDSIINLFENSILTSNSQVFYIKEKELILVKNRGTYSRKPEQKITIFNKNGETISNYIFDENNFLVKITDVKYMIENNSLLINYNNSVDLKQHQINISIN